jgi:hypothetical protein
VSTAELETPKFIPLGSDLYRSNPGSFNTEDASSFHLARRASRFPSSLIDFRLRNATKNPQPKTHPPFTLCVLELRQIPLDAFRIAMDNSKKGSNWAHYLLDFLARTRRVLCF